MFYIWLPIRFWRFFKDFVMTKSHGSLLYFRLAIKAFPNTPENGGNQNNEVLHSISVLLTYFEKKTIG